MYYRKPKPETMKKNREEYKKLYSEEIAWCKENINLLKGNKFLVDMYSILITGSRKMTPKMIGAVQKAMTNPMYDPIKRIEKTQKMQPIIEKINRVWELVAEIDEEKDDYYLQNFSALPFVNSIKDQAQKNLRLSPKQMEALNKVYKKYKEKFDKKNAEKKKD
tara:strand:+ start:1524 stop:2012 length:489 start_codon:yes stop_codon:yes gene_type:complete